MSENENSARPRSDFIYTKNTWGRSWRKSSFYWRKIGRTWTILRGRCWWKSSFYWKKIGRTWTNFQYISKFSAMRTAGGRCVRKWRFSKEETAFAGSKLFSGAFILYSVRNEQLGAMRQKMAIFKERNSVCRVNIFLMIMMMMARAKRERVVQDGVEKANRRPTRPDRHGPPPKG